MEKLNYSGGRPSSLDEETKTLLYHAIERGLTLRQCCDYAGISYATLRNWIRRGEDEEARLANNTRAKVRKRERPFLVFLEGYRHAMAESKVTLADTIKLAADGGHTTTEETTRTEKERRGRGKAAQLVVTKEVTIKTVKVASPDWRAALAMLERRDPENWGRRQLLEHKGEAVGAAVGAINIYADMEEEEVNERIEKLIGQYDQKREDRPYPLNGSEPGEEPGSAAAGASTGEEGSEN